MKWGMTLGYTIHLKPGTMELIIPLRQKMYPGAEPAKTATPAEVVDRSAADAEPQVAMPSEEHNDDPVNGDKRGTSGRVLPLPPYLLTEESLAGAPPARVLLSRASGSAAHGVIGYRSGRRPAAGAAVRAAACC